MRGDQKGPLPDSKGDPMKFVQTLKTALANLRGNRPAEPREIKPEEADGGIWPCDPEDDPEYLEWLAECQKAPEEVEDEDPEDCEAVITEFAGGLYAEWWPCGFNLANVAEISDEASETLCVMPGGTGPIRPRRH